MSVIHRNVIMHAFTDAQRRKQGSQSLRDASQVPRYAKRVWKHQIESKQCEPSRRWRQHKHLSGGGGSQDHRQWKHQRRKQ